MAMNLSQVVAAGKCSISGERTNVQGATKILVPDVRIAMAAVSNYSFDSL